MKKCLLPCIFFLTILQAKAQLGFTVASTLNSSPDWQVVVENYVAHRHFPFLRYGTEAAIDYSFSLKNEAIRIQPAIHYMRATSWYYPHYFEVNAAGLLCNLNLALLPDQRRDGKEVVLRPLLQLSTGIDWSNQRYDYPLSEDGQPFSGDYRMYIDHSLVFNAGAAVLFEIKLTSLLHLSPMAGVRFYPAMEWKGFTHLVSEGSMKEAFDRTNWRQFMAGIRIGLNLGRVRPEAQASP